MKHLNEDALIARVYDGAPEVGGEGEEEERRHLQECGECRERLEDLRRELTVWDQYGVPERGAEYGREVWDRLAPRIAEIKPAGESHRLGRLWFKRFGAFQSRFRGRAVWVWGPAMAALLVVAFLAGRWTREPGRNEAPASMAARTQDRVLLMAVSEHLERSQILLTELSHADSGDEAGLEPVRERARELIPDNRLLRQSAWRAGDRSDAVLLDDLERVLVDVANTTTGSDVTAGQALQRVQNRMGENSLLFRVRVTALEAKKKGQRL